MLGAAPALASSFVSWASILLHGCLDICLDMLPEAPIPPLQKWDAQHKFLQHRGAHADSDEITQIIDGQMGECIVKD